MRPSAETKMLLAGFFAWLPILLFGSLYNSYTLDGWINKWSILAKIVVPIFFLLGIYFRNERLLLWQKFCLLNLVYIVGGIIIFFFFRELTIPINNPNYLFYSIAPSLLGLNLVKIQKPIWLFIYGFGAFYISTFFVAYTPTFYLLQIISNVVLYLLFGMMIYNFPLSFFYKISLFLAFAWLFDISHFIDKDKYFPLMGLILLIVHTLSALLGLYVNQRFKILNLE